MTPELEQAFDDLNESSNRVYLLFNLYEYNAERDMHDHLINQFQDKPVIRAVLNALGSELDLIYRAAGDLMTKRWINTGEGAQLDGIGRIVGRDRTIPNAVYLPFFGFYGQPNTGGFDEAPFRDSGVSWLASNILDDGPYRKILWAKVFKNSSQCTHEDTISMLKAIFDVETVTVEDAGNAKIRLGVGKILTKGDLMLIKAYNLFVRAGGVGIRFVVMYDAAGYFGFHGQPKALGFNEGIFADIVEY